MAMGAFPETHPLSLGMLGMHGTAYANWAVHECSLLVAVGARFDDRVTGKLSAFAPQAKVIHVDIDPAEIGKNVEPQIPIVGDARRVLADLVAELKGMERTPGLTREWLARIEELREQHPLAYHDEGEGIPPQFVVQEIDRVTGGDAVIATDVGQHQMWACQYFRYTQPRQLVSSGGLGTMGFGLPAAIGAQIGRPDKQVIDIGGDGSFQMTMQELGTAMAYEVPVVVAILNNRYLGMVRQWQDLFWNKRYSHTYFETQPDFAKIARGLRGLRRHGDREGPGRRRPARGDQGPAAGRHRLPRAPGGERLPDGALRRLDHGDDRRHGRAEEEAMKHTLSVLVENKPGVLTRVAGLFARRGFNIDSLVVGESEDPRLSRMTITIDGAAHPIDQVTKQLHKLINVVKIRELDPEHMVARELALIKVNASGATRSEIVQIVEIFEARVVDVDKRTLTIEMASSPGKLLALQEMLQPFGVIEIVRTGTVAIARG